ncbi:folylpolyglutamate synthase [Stylonychia lemnae]|uniref:Folylpolyglutamate synthase n=1 Tax=Stylonychia lemnae TaxID=5949 RepID=A0A078A384_STYLE|nr:folylpolyglutamate synthase [Stylonychia lemnae]|eukprot:CDW75224.1 folylpolyglutamate synthase [Stylonychia lemnae]
MFRKFGPGEKANIDQMVNLTSCFGNPQNQFKSIHIAGTNGKGTVSIKTARILESAGFKTGLFISPHISSFRERITINQQLISQEDVVKHAESVFETIEKQKLNVTFFEIVTMIALLQFAEQKVDYAVLECGMGGRLDATNVITKPEVCAITSIGFDHMEILGTTLEQIAEEKAGIIKQDIPVVLGPTVNQQSVIKKVREMNSKLVEVKWANFRKANQEVVNNIVDLLGVDISEEARANGMSFEQPCRLEKVPESNLKAIFEDHDEDSIVYMDICHNPQAVEAVIEEITKRHPDQKIQIACGFSKNKDHTAMMHYMASHASVTSVYPITSNHFKICPIEEIQDRVKEVQKLFLSFEKPATVFQEPIQGGLISSTLEQVIKESQKQKDIVLICGSFYIMADVREYLKYDDVFDHKEVNFK